MIFFNRDGSMDVLNITLEGEIANADDHHVQLSTVNW